MHHVADNTSAFAYQDALRRLLSLVDHERMAGLTAPVPKYGLERMGELTKRLGNPQRAVPIVHVAGTKGKGSTAMMISSILVAAGWKVGLFTSPHLHSFRERLRVDGHPLSGDRFVAALNHVWPCVETMAVSYTHLTLPTSDLV